MTIMLQELIDWLEQQVQNYSPDLGEHQRSYAYGRMVQAIETINLLESMLEDAGWEFDDA